MGDSILSQAEIDALLN
nr:Chain D, FLAGELLAR MOTOR SWITCH PROTEIN [Escherichia coli]1F4V_E Chain E, FLAGELLAR MOTOR SWITCH PROTEIN [Escherichia coli]1F4V_F Chain F, FLAGELLAR MOTOR SWITCH PROTEIN [Escherichia coli]1U8T_E Chain E, Flagellar motor switch protein fliM [synthetic construct]1U8T_F Chain F, Flagellar motor switch protein fliM [synthetic construct]2B1J_C Chain C, Flagellar motor switch protein fliM [synthetic construct]2B1J_D Chain D, Flagellar motor switch protein fliM [synthetic construct]